ncbi:MAG: D-tyrosyl-tRNA(Tyr) deacylase [Spirochaetia bacterium]|nr:D-tyrosyl-tRNA(Tyr) deacylase [Spirochaetia bacterium]MBR0319154.1 D-tyrosyl-tRNA(Tyr) deacylase [Spirochaetia bacterium]
MRAVVQRVLNAQVQVGDQCVGRIAEGVLVYLGVHKDDTDKDFDYILDKVINLRIFSDADGRMNLSVLDTGGEILVVSQFTLLGDARRGRRPSYGEAAGNEKGNLYYQRFLYSLKEKGIKTASGQFGADMLVSYTNDGPVTILLDSFKDF